MFQHSGLRIRSRGEGIRARDVQSNVQQGRTLGLFTSARADVLHADQGHCRSETDKRALELSHSVPVAVASAQRREAMCVERSPPGGGRPAIMWTVHVQPSWSARALAFLPSQKELLVVHRFGRDPQKQATVTVRFRPFLSNCPKVVRQRLGRGLALESWERKTAQSSHVLAAARRSCAAALPGRARCVSALL